MTAFVRSSVNSLKGNFYLRLKNQENRKLKPSNKNCKSRIQKKIVLVRTHPH